MTHTDAALEAAIQKAVMQGVRVLVVQDRTQRFRLEACLLGVSRGWLAEGRIVPIDSQSSIGEWDVLPACLAYFGIQGDEAAHPGIQDT